MSGNEDSWQAQLEDAGYEVKTIVKGLGEMKGIRNILVEHIEAVL
jgi:sirohydrochlorin cobaltochelatase